MSQGQLPRLGYDPKSRRHVVDGYELHCGDFIDLMIQNRWIPGRYEATWSGGAPDAAFYFDDKSEVTGDIRERVIPLVVGAICRRPL